MTIEFLRPCGYEYPDGKDFGEWGPMWGYHFDGSGKWVRGQVDRDGVLQGQHGGRDIVCPKGTTLLNPADGSLVFAGWQDTSNPKKGYGLCVLIELSESRGLILTGGHFSQLFVTAGQHVKRGAAIGVSGDTGNVDGPHSHWQLEKDGPYPRDPLNFTWVSV